MLVYFLSALGGTIYNTNGMLRFVLLFIWIVTPIFAVLFNKIDFKKLFLPFFILIVFNISVLKNANTFSLDFSGPAAEMLTLPLFLFGFLFIERSKALSFIDDRDFIRFFNFLVFSILCVFIIDFLMRYSKSPVCTISYACRGEGKYGGLFSNSNIVGQICGLFLCAVFAFRYKINKILMLFLLFFLLLSFSRAAWVATFLGVLISFVRWNFRSIFLFIALCLILLVLIITDPLNFANDGSGLSKVGFFTFAIALLGRASLVDSFLGFGASFDTITSLLDMNDWSPHASIVKSFLYFGILGVLCYILILYYHFSQVRGALPVVMFTLIIGLSGAPIYWPTLSVVIGLECMRLSKSTAVN